LPHRSFARFASPVAALAVAALACCAPIVPAPLYPPQPPYGYRPPPAPPPGPSAAPTPPATAGPVKVALLVPLSGANAELGVAILDAAELALFETSGDRLILVPRDTGGNAEGAASAARAVIGEGARLILGPLLEAEVEAVKPLARDAHLDVIAFSTVADLAGGNVFLMGFLPRQEVIREVAFARERGLARFAALAPNTRYGHLMTEALRDAAASSGGSVSGIAFYDPRAGDAAAAIQRLMPQSAQDGPSPATPAPVFDALLLPEGGARLDQIARQVKAAQPDAKSVQLLGSGLWDVPDIASEPALIGGWFAASPPQARQGFEERYRATYGHDPPRLASLGYDAAALAGALVRSEGGISHQAILDPSGFAGVDGRFRFTPGGLVQRGLAVLEVEPQGAVVISPTPQGFQDLGY
jgi:branched-chain amino acid transport system substrate-binding protein